MAAVRSGFGIGLDYRQNGIAKDIVVGWRTALITLTLRKQNDSHELWGKSISCCSALARFPELSKV
jgi:hypothetical protein